jgi:hypothetical protein
MLATLDPWVIPYVSTDQWVYATDADGNVLDVKKTIGREQVILTTTRPVDKFDLTIVSSGYVNTDGTMYINMDTYADVDRGSTFKLQYGPSFTLADPVSVAFKLNNYSGPPNGVWFTNCSYTDYQETIAGGTFNANLSMYGLPTNVLLTSYHKGVPVYAKIQGVKGGDQIELDMNNNFTPFEHQRKLDFSEYYNAGNIAAAYLDNKGELSSLYFDLISTYRLDGSQDATNQPLIGYIDGFDIYRMNVVSYQTSGYVNYQKQGDIGSSFESFTMPSFNFKVVNTDLPHFTYEFSEDFTYYTASFKYKVNKATMDWTIHAPQGKDVKIGNIPAEITAAYPLLRPEAFEFSECALTKVIMGDTYKESILRLQRDLSREFECYVFIPNH